VDGALVGRPATSDGGQWLGDDVVPGTLLPLLGVFFEEMWPVLADAARTLAAFVASNAHAPGDELPGKTFTATPGFEALQTGEGALTHAFTIGGVESRRMVVPYQMWMLGRLEGVLGACTATDAGRATVEKLLDAFPRGRELLGLDGVLAGCRVRKDGARIRSC
jgi:hypothetical protein